VNVAKGFVSPNGVLLAAVDCFIMPIAGITTLQHSAHVGGHLPPTILENAHEKLANYHTPVVGLAEKGFWPCRN
jgi:hypothetical protein